MYFNHIMELANVDIAKGTYVFICAGDEAGATAGRVIFTDLRLVRENTCVGFEENLPLNRAFQAPDYTISIVENQLVAGYKFDVAGYRVIEMLLTADDIASYNKLVGTITATADVHVIIKPQDAPANEINVALKKDVPTPVEHLFSSPFDPMWAKVIIMIAVDGSDTLEGSVNFGDLHLEAYDPHKVGKGKNVASYSGAFLDQYTFRSDCYSLERDDDGNIVVDYKKSAVGWENIQAFLELPETWWKIEDYHRFVGTFYSTVAAKILIKPFDNGLNEKWVELVPEERTRVDYVFDKATCDIEKPIVIFIAPGDNPGPLEGKVWLDDLLICREDANVEDKYEGAYPDIINLNKIGDAANCYDIDQGGGDYIDIYYNKNLPDDRYASLQFFTKARDYRRMNHFVFEAMAMQDCQVIIKIGDNPANEKVINMKEGERVSLTEERINVPIDAYWDKTVLMIGTGENDVFGIIHINQFCLRYIPD